MQDYNKNSLYQKCPIHIISRYLRDFNLTLDRKREMNKLKLIFFLNLIYNEFYYFWWNQNIFGGILYHKSSKCFWVWQEIPCGASEHRQVAMVAPSYHLFFFSYNPGLNWSTLCICDWNIFFNTDESVIKSFSCPFVQMMQFWIGFWTQNGIHFLSRITSFWHNRWQSEMWEVFVLHPVLGSQGRWTDEERKGKMKRELKIKGA